MEKANEGRHEEILENSQEAVQPVLSSTGVIGWESWEKEQHCKTDRRTGPESTLAEGLWDNQRELPRPNKLIIPLLCEMKYCSQVTLTLREKDVASGLNTSSWETLLLGWQMLLLNPSMHHSHKNQAASVGTQWRSHLLSKPHFLIAEPFPAVKSDFNALWYYLYPSCVNLKASGAKNLLQKLCHAFFNLPLITRTFTSAALTMLHTCWNLILFASLLSLHVQHERWHPLVVAGAPLSGEITATEAPRWSWTSFWVTFQGQVAPLLSFLCTDTERVGLCRTSEVLNLVNVLLLLHVTIKVFTLILSLQFETAVPAFPFHLYTRPGHLLNLLWIQEGVVLLHLSSTADTYRRFTK